MLYLLTALIGFGIGYAKALRDAQTGDRGKRRGNCWRKAKIAHKLREHRKN